MGGFIVRFSPRRRLDYELRMANDLAFQTLQIVEKIMTDLTALQGAVAQLGTDVDTLLAGGSGGPTQADVDAITSSVAATDAKIQAAIADAAGVDVAAAASSSDVTAAADVTTTTEAGSDGAADNTQAADTTAGADVAPNA